MNQVLIEEHFLLSNENLSDQLYEQANRYRVLNLAERLDFIGKIPGPMRTRVHKQRRNIPKYKEKTLRLFLLTNKKMSNQLNYITISGSILS